MTDDELVALAVELGDAIASCAQRIEEDRERGLPTVRVERARKIFDRGIRTIREIQRTRAGEHPLFTKARPVTDWMSAYDAHRAINRLLGLCRAEHDALAAFIEQNAPRFEMGLSPLGPTLDAVLTAWGNVDRAISAAIGDLEEPTA